MAKRVWFEMSIMNSPTKNSILKTVDQKFRQGEVVLAVCFAKWKLLIRLKFKSANCIIPQIFEAYQIVGAEHQNRLLAIVRSVHSTALFSFNVSNYPPINLSDLHIESVVPINGTLFIDSSSGFGVSSHQFQIISGIEQTLYYYYPDDETCRSKEIFEKLLKKLIQGKIWFWRWRQSVRDVMCRYF